MSDLTAMKKTVMELQDGPSVRTRSMVLFSAAVFVALMVVFSIFLRDPKSQNYATGPSNQVAVMSSAGESSEAWYCPGPMPVGAWPSSYSSVDLANLGQDALHVTVDVSNSVSSQVSKIHAVISAESGTVIPLSRTLPKSFAAVSIIADGPGLAATEVVMGQDGESSASCVNSTAKTVALPSGSTLDGKNINLSLYNPAQTATVVNVGIDLLNARSQEQSLAPGPLQGITLQPGQLKTFDVGKSIPQEPSVGLVVNAIGGEITAGAQLIDPGFANLGEGSLVTAAIPTANRWIFPPVPAGYRYLNTYSLLNPNDSTVKVLFSVISGITKSTFLISLPAESETVLSPPVYPIQPSIGELAAISPKAGSSVINQAYKFLSARQTPAMVSIEVKEHKSLPLVIERTVTVVAPGNGSSTSITPAAVTIVHAYSNKMANETAKTLGLADLSPADIKAVSTLPTLSAGTATVNALSAPAQKWLLLPGSSDARVGQLFTLYNPGNKSTKVTLRKLNMTTTASVAAGSYANRQQQDFMTMRIPGHSEAMVDPDYLIGEPGPIGVEIISKWKIVVGSIDYSRGKSLGVSLANALPIG